jgi:multisubunit Na+/H+ antiporter MnhE subunit
MVVANFIRLVDYHFVFFVGNLVKCIVDRLFNRIKFYYIRPVFNIIVILILVHRIKIIKASITVKKILRMHSRKTRMTFQKLVL